MAEELNTPVRELDRQVAEDCVAPTVSGHQQSQIELEDLVRTSVQETSSFDRRSSLGEGTTALISIIEFRNELV